MNPLDQIEQAVDKLREVSSDNKQYIIVHHSATEDRNALDWGALRRGHLRRGWRDIGYHYGIEMVDGGPEILIGRFEFDSGAHCPQQRMNHIGLGICCVGNFDISPPPDDIWDAALSFVGHLQERLFIPREYVMGHKEVPGTATACPGRFWDMDKFRAGL